MTARAASFSTAVGDAVGVAQKLESANVGPDGPQMIGGLGHFAASTGRTC